MKSNRLALACVALLSAASAVVTGCAGDRPLRNGVPNEQLFLRKAFIIRPGAGGTPEKPAEDDGWMLKSTVMSTSTPNPLASSVLWPGAENNGMLVRFVATQDRLQLVNIRELSDNEQIKAQGTRTPEVVDAWAAKHVDLKLTVTGDGEKTNRFEENQELDWRVRQWVEVNLAKNDLTDFALFGNQYSAFLSKCAGGSSTTVVPGSIMVDEKHDYLEWKVSVTLPIKMDDEKCVESYGEAGTNFMRLGRNNVSAVVKYSMMRATPREKLSYPTLEIAEKDPIRRKYGPIWETSYARDQETGQFAARQFAVRFDPNKDMVLYFAKGYPEEKKGMFTDPGGIVDQTNAIFEKSGAKIRLVVKNYDQDMGDELHPLEKDGSPERHAGREYGDIRYSFIRWMSDVDIGAPFIGVTQFIPDPRTGEAISASINIADFPLKEFVAVRVDSFLESIMCRASTKDPNGKDVCSGFLNDQPWGPPMKEVLDDKGRLVTDEKGKPVLKPMADTCTPGETVPLLPSKLNETYGISSLYSKMQEYLGEPAAQKGPLGPRNFVAGQDRDFENAYFKVLPYYIFADPAANPFVTPVGDGGEFGEVEQMEALQRSADFHKLTAKLDRGEPPFDLSGGSKSIEQGIEFLDKIQKGILNRRDREYKQNFFHHETTKLDAAGDLVAFTGVMERAGRRCVDGHWETREEWQDKLIQTYHALTVWHEFGHLLGLDHNFMGSIDKPNYPHYKAENCDPNTDPTKCDRVGMFSSSVMEYSATPDRIFWSNESGKPGWASYDRAALGWLYGNELPPSPEKRAEAKGLLDQNKTPEYVSGQYRRDLPWNDPEGFRDDGTEISFLYCNASHLRFTPFCRQHDFGVTPSEIIANEIEAYEWQYAWRNFRKYRKTWDIHNYADLPAKEIIELRRFLPPWRADWRDDTLRDDFGRFGILPPAELGANSKQLYYQQLATKFDDELSQTNQMVAAFHLALIQQSSGERPFATIYDKFNGDVTQQGISLDKQFAMQGWVGLWPSDNYDPNQRGNFISSYGDSFDPEYNSVAQKAVSNMIGVEVFDSYPALQFSAVILFAKDTHNPLFGGQNNIKDWVGGYAFAHDNEFQEFFKKKAVERGKYPEFGCARGPVTQNPTLQTCTYDPRTPRADTGNEALADQTMEFLGPDDRNYIILEIPDRRWWVVVDRTRNIATYRKMKDFHTNITVNQIQDDRLYTALLPIKFHIDSYIKFNNGPPIP